MEAALDEANVIRYAQFLNDLSEKHSLLSLRIEKVPWVFGSFIWCYNAKSGVSKLVSVNLNTIDEVMKEENA